MRKLDFAYAKTKTQCSNCTVDQPLCFHYTDSTISPPLISKISSFWPFSVTIQASLCQKPEDLFSGLYHAVFSAGRCADAV